MKNRTHCPCGSGADFESCCGAILSGRRTARTAEELMRSRYAAYVVEDVDYLVRTTHPDARIPELATEIRAWMAEVSWLRLHVLTTDSAGDKTARVEFVAEYMTQAGPGRHHERSVFRKQKGQWYYLTAES